jgi:hypothetical protein|nr:MAG TPA: hypothetical protein [Caudoviricetes sp.]
MKTIFKVGMKVYDQVFFGDDTLEIIEVRGDMSLRVLYGEATYCYTGDGRFIGDDIISNRWNCISQIPTLSTSPYTLQGFEQKAPIPTFEDAIKWLRENNKYDVSISEDSKVTYFTKNENYPVFEAIRKLIILRDYYNEGWKPDWKSDEFKYCIQVYKGDIETMNYNTIYKVMYFKTPEIRDKFLEEQRELLEIAKPLL